MKREFAKWIMDIAKYIVTVVLLTTIPGDTNSPLVFAVGVAIALACLLWGIWILRSEDEKDKNNKMKRK